MMTEPKFEIGDPVYLNPGATACYEYDHISISPATFETLKKYKILHITDVDTSGPNDFAHPAYHIQETHALLPEEIFIPLCDCTPRWARKGDQEKKVNKDLKVK